MTEAMMNVDEGGGKERKVVVDYPGNSKKARQEPAAEKEKVTKIVTGQVIKKKPGLMAKLFGNSVSEDSGTISEFVVTEVLLPAAKNMISETVSMMLDAMREGVERTIFGDSRSSRSSGRRTTYTSYNTRYGGRTRPEDRDGRPVMSRQQRAQHDFGEIILANRGDAEEVLDRLRDLVAEYDVATVNDFYDLVGLTGEFTDDKWGWTDLRDARVQPVRGGYVLRMPRTRPIT